MTARELDVLRGVARAWTNAEIAEHLVVGVATVKTYISRLITKLGVRDRVGASERHHVTGPFPREEEWARCKFSLQAGARRSRRRDHEVMSNTANFMPSETRGGHHHSVPAIECRDLRIAYSGQQVLDGFFMSVYPGRVHALLGRNGAGKSTCFRIILGIERRNTGSVSLFGQPNSREGLRQIGASVNGPALYPHLTALDNVRVHAELLGLGKNEAEQILGAVGLTNTGRKRARNFSTGMKARLALAIAMLGSPRVLLLDEPQNGLDPQGIADLRAFLREWARTGGAVLVSSHQLGEMALLADDITVLTEGRAAYSGPLTGFAHPDALEQRFLQLTEGSGVAA